MCVLAESVACLGIKRPGALSLPREDSMEAAPGGGEAPGL